MSNIEIRGFAVPIDPASVFVVNNYLVWREGSDFASPDDSQECVLIDASAHPELIMEQIGSKKLTAIILTHRHFDHVGAAAELVRATGAKVYAHEQDSDVIEQGSFDVFSNIRSVDGVRVDTRLKGGERLKLANVEFEVIHTPGHSTGSICLLSKEEQVLFSGDTLFKGTTGRTDFEEGSPAQMADSLKVLSKLDDAIMVLPGHDATTTIGAERNRALVEY